MSEKCDVPLGVLQALNGLCPEAFVQCQRDRGESRPETPDGKWYKRVEGAVGITPIRRWPCSPRAAPRVDSNVRSYCASNARELSRKTRPASVSSTPRATRRNS